MARRAGKLAFACVALSGHARRASAADGATSQTDARLAFTRLAMTLLAMKPAAFVGLRRLPSAQQAPRAGVSKMQTVPSWEELKQHLPSSDVPEPRIIDSVLEPKQPALKGLTLYRERHGWCPYSERVWLALELKGLDYETVLIENCGFGPKPSWWGGSTPQIRWEDGRKQGESLDIVRILDKEYPDTLQLWPDEEVTFLVNSFKRIFPSNTRPSSRAAFLFKGWGNDPIARSEFEKTLDGADKLLGKHSGPFFYGAQVSAADIAWAPFLERYAEQLPCLHPGLDPRDPKKWPRLAAWYDAMEQKVPAYAARVRGDNVSWRRVLQMAGFGNMGIAPVLVPEDPTKKMLHDRNEGDWSAYVADRPYVAESPGKEAAARVVRNRAAITKDAVKQGSFDAEEVDSALRGLAAVLAGLTSEADASPSVKAAAQYLDERLCVPRDMGVLPARVVRRLAESLGDSR